MYLFISKHETNLFHFIVKKENPVRDKIIGRAVGSNRINRAKPQRFLNIIGTAYSGRIIDGSIGVDFDRWRVCIITRGNPEELYFPRELKRPVPEPIRREASKSKDAEDHIEADNWSVILSRNPKRLVLFFVRRSTRSIDVKGKGEHRGIHGLL